MEPNEISRIKDGLSDKEKKQEIKKVVKNGILRAFKLMVGAFISFLLQVWVVQILWNFAMPGDYQMGYWQAFALVLAINFSTHNVFNEALKKILSNKESKNQDKK